MATSPSASYEEIEDELIVQQTMMDSLDPDDHTSREDIKRTIQELEERLESFSHDAQARAQNHTEWNGLGRGQGQVPGQGQTLEQDSVVRNSSSGGNAAGGNSCANDYSADLALPHLPGAFPTTSQYGAQSPNRTHTFGQPSMPYKRPFEQSSPDANEERIKRITPTSSRSHTPLSFMNSGNQPHGGYNRRAVLLEQQRLREADLRRRRDAELADAAYARRISEQPRSMHSPSLPSYSSLTAGPSPLHSYSPMSGSSALRPHPPSAFGPSSIHSHPSMPGPSRPPLSSTSSGHKTSPSQLEPIFRPRVKQERPASPGSSMTSPYSSLNSSHNNSANSSPGHGPLQSNPMNSYPFSPVMQPTHSPSSHSYSPANHRLKTEVKPESSRSPLRSVPRYSGPTPVVDLTGSDDDDESDQVIDLTRPHYRNMDPYGSDALRAAQLAVAQKRHHQVQAAHEARMRLSQQQLQHHLARQQMSRYDPMNQSSSSAGPAYSPLAQAAMRGMGAARDMVHGFVGDLSQLSGLVRGRDLNRDEEMYYRNRYLPNDYSPRDMDYIDPEATREDLRKLMENIQPEEEYAIEAEGDIPVTGMTVKLKPYQMTGLKWMQKMETGSNKGGILADDMGLGKTVQAISLLVTHKSEDPVNKTTLILAPVALLRQWQEEIAQKIRLGSHSLRVFLQHGSAKKKTHRELREFDVVLTTFGTIASEQKRMEKYLLRKQNDPDAQPRDDEKCLFIGPECKWYRIIVDEAQCIKNKSTRTAKAAYQLNARSRFCLTGTPMMNGVDELYSLVHFLRIKPYSDWQRFNMDFVRPLKGANEVFRQAAMQKLQALLKAILLRRNKQTKINGKPILTLPERVIEETHAVFNDDEKAFYLGLEGKQQIEFNKYLKAGTVGRSYAHILLLLLRLRQACCHPHLIKDFGVAAAADIDQSTMDDLCRSLSEAVIERIKASEGIFECPVCFDAVENPAIFVPCGHKTCTECFTRIADPANGVANGDEGGRTSKCPECRAPINTKSVVDYECFKKIHMSESEPVAVDPAEAETDSEIDTDSDDSDSDGEDDDDDKNGDNTLDGFIVRDDVDSQASTESETEGEANREIAVVDGKEVTQKKKMKQAKGKSKASESSSSKSKKSKKAKGKQKVKKSKHTLPELKKLAGTSKKHKKMYMEMVSKDYIPSAKIEKTMEIIQGVMDGAEKEKIIIFSQWTSLLDLLEIDIDRRGFGYRRYDGSMNAKLRGDAVQDFKTHDRVRMMLVSLKAGNAGLNLNVASQVIILDPFWNPYIEEQAIDRAHRLGQQRPVKVHRILVEETVEDRILALQEKKRAVISEALDEKASQGVSRLSPQELAYLFGINRNINDPLVVRRN